MILIFPCILLTLLAVCHNTLVGGKILPNPKEVAFTEQTDSENIRHQQYTTPVTAPTEIDGVYNNTDEALNKTDNPREIPTGMDEKRDSNTTKTENAKVVNGTEATRSTENGDLNRSKQDLNGKLNEDLSVKENGSVDNKSEIKTEVNKGFSDIIKSDSNVKNSSEKAQSGKTEFGKPNENFNHRESTETKDSKEVEAESNDKATKNGTLGSVGEISDAVKKYQYDKDNKAIDNNQTDNIKNHTSDVKPGQGQPENGNIGSENEATHDKERAEGDKSVGKTGEDTSDDSNNKDEGEKAQSDAKKFEKPNENSNHRERTETNGGEEVEAGNNDQSAKTGALGSVGKTSDAVNKDQTDKDDKAIDNNEKDDNKPDQGRPENGNIGSENETTHDKEKLEADRSVGKAGGDISDDSNNKDEAEKTQSDETKFEKPNEIPNHKERTETNGGKEVEAESNDMATKNEASSSEDEADEDVKPNQDQSETANRRAEGEINEVRISQDNSVNEASEVKQDKPGESIPDAAERRKSEISHNHNLAAEQSFEYSFFALDSPQFYAVMLLCLFIGTCLVIRNRRKFNLQLSRMQHCFDNRQPSGSSYQKLSTTVDESDVYKHSHLTKNYIY